MSTKLPCLFCFSSSGQAEGHRYQGDKGRRARVYRFLRDLLGIRLAPAEDFDSLGVNYFLPLCVTCSLIFRNLCGLYDQLLLLQEKINSVVQEIRVKIKNSERDEFGSVLALAVQSIGDSESFGQPATSGTSSSSLAWVQKFRQKVVDQEGDTSFSTQNVLFVTGIQQLIEQQGQGVAQLIQEGYTVADGSTTFYLAQEATATSPPTHHEEVEVDYDDIVSTDEAQGHEYNEEEDGDGYPISKDEPDSADLSSDDSDPEHRKITLKTRLRSQKCTQPITVKSKATTGALPKLRRKIGNVPSPKSSTRRKNSSVKKPLKKPRLTKKIELKKYKCHLCAWSFDKSYQLKSHILTHTGVELQAFNCEACNQTFFSRKAVQKHNSLHHGDCMPFKCTLCTVKRSTADALKSHMKVHDDGLEGPPWTCSICKDGRRFAHKINLKRHLIRHKQITKFHCTFCASNFSRKEDMMNHMTQKHRDIPMEDGKTFDCNLCPRKYPIPAELITHIWSHGTTKRLTCYICQIVFLTIDELTLHDEQNHGVKVSRIQCKICESEVVTESMLKRHMKIHQPKAVKVPKMCEICDKTFYDTNTLSRHVRIFHEDNGRPFSCKQCERSFHRKDDLKKHFQRIHENPKTSNLQLSHEKQRCEECKKYFSDKNKLDGHIKVCHQLGDNGPFKCQICTKTFKRSDELRTHERNQHKLSSHKTISTTASPEIGGRTTNEQMDIGITRFECDICDKDYKRSKDLRKHEKANHGLIYSKKNTIPTSKTAAKTKQHRVQVIVTSLVTPSPDGTESRDVGTTTSETIVAEMCISSCEEDEESHDSSASNSDSGSN